MAVGILLTVVRTLLYMAPDIPADAVDFVLLSHTVPYDRQPPRTDNYASCIMTHEESIQQDPFPFFFRRRFIPAIVNGLWTKTAGCSNMRQNSTNTQSYSVHLILNMIYL